MPKLTDELLNRGLEAGMSVVQKVLSHPTVGPMFMRAVRQTLELRQSLQESREKVLERMQIASFQEQEQLRRNLTSVEKKLERIERRLRQMQQRAKEAEQKVAAFEAAQKQAEENKE